MFEYLKANQVHFTDRSLYTPFHDAMSLHSMCIATAASTSALHITVAHEHDREHAEKPDAMQTLETVLTHAELH
jgi:hypothetical protein